MRLRNFEPKRALAHSLPGAPAGAIVAVLLGVTGCTHPGASRGEDESADSPPRLLLGATKGEALDGGASSFALESTPDLVLHATLRDATYEGKTLLVRGSDPTGAVVWSYPHVQRGTDFDAVLPVFGSAPGRKHITGAYSFQVLAPDRSVVAAATAVFRSASAVAAAQGGQ
jgi:hypothetical protein